MAEEQSPGDLFRQRRQQKQQQQSQQQQSQQQQSQQQQSSRRGGGGDRGDRGGGGRRGGGGGGGGSSRHGGNSRGGGRPSGPIEQGRIARLCDNFGFIYCASRPADMFFHYSSFRQGHAADLNVGDEVEFRVEQDRRKGDGGEAAFDLRLLESGTVIWEDLVEGEGVRTRGVVERPAYAGRGGDRGGGEREGTIRILLEDDDAEESKKQSGSNESGDDDGANDDDEKQKPQGALVRYSASDYQPKVDDDDDDDNQNGNAYSKQDFRSSKPSPNDKLFRGDVVDFVLVSNRRSQLRYARDIGLIQSERERWEEEREAALLEGATEEQGVVVSLKHQFGFIRSNRRKEEIYFHFSSIELPDHDEDEDAEEETEYTLHEGVCLSFRVVDEGNLPEKYRTRPGGGRDGRRGSSGGSGPSGAGKISARCVRFLPEGSVKFQHVLARGVTGRVVSRPIPPPPPPPGAGRGGRKTDDALMGGMPGKVHLEVPIECNDPEILQLLGGVDNDDDSPKDSVTIVDVDLPPGLSPGGTFAATRDGSRVAVWVHEMDKLLFDVVVDYVDGTIRVEPTTCLLPASEVHGAAKGQDGEEEEEEEEEEETASNDNESDNTKGKGRKKKKNKKPKAAVRLISPSLTGRAEGIVHLVKDNFGFIHLAERNADAYFRLYDVFPPETNADIVRFGRSEAGTYDPNAKEFTPPKITAGTEVSFDIFVQPGGVQQQPTYGGRNRPGNSRENVKAIRLAVLPPGTIVQSKTLASGVRGVVKKEDPKQPFAGTIELESPVQRMSAEERHPLVAKLLEDIENDPRDDASVVFHHLESVQENKVVEAMVRARKGKLSLEYIPSSSGAVDDKNPGRLRIFKAFKADASAADNKAEETDGDATNVEKEEENGSGDADVDEDEKEGEGKDKSNQRQKKAKEITTVRYDKHSLPDDEFCDPPRLDDVITCDVVQSRRSGAISVTNVRIVERKSKIRSHGAGKGNVGIVADVNESRHFGFIDIVDDHATSGDLMFFHCSDLQAPSSPAGEGEAKEDAMEDGDDTSKPASKPPPAAKIKISKGDEVKFDIVIDAKTGKQIAKCVEVLPRGTLGLPEVSKQGRSEANLCRGIILMEPSHTSLGNTPSRKPVGLSKTAATEGGRWANPDAKAGKGEDAGASELERGRVLLLEDPAGSFAIREDNNGDDNAAEGADTNGEEAKAKPTPRIISAVGTHVTYTNTSAGMTSASVDRTRAPRRGDLVTFVAGKKKGGAGGSSVSNIRVTKPVGATIIRGNLSDINKENKEAVFQASTAGKERYQMKFGEVVSCDPSILKDGEDVEGILHDGNIFGVCRTKDLYLTSKVTSAGARQRPKLNLTVKKELKDGLGGQIMAQSGMAKGPDGTCGFVDGWTKRKSPYAPPSTEEEALAVEAAPASAEATLNVAAAEFNPHGM